MASVWILRKKNSGLVLWQQQGGDPQGIVLDNAEYHKIFAASFPKMQISWGAGDFEMILVSCGATYKIGGVVSYTLEKKEHVLSDIASGPGCTVNVVASHTGDGTAIKIIHDPEEEIKQVLGTTGLPKGVVLEDGIPQTKAEAPTRKSSIKSVGHPAMESNQDTSMDSATFHLLMRNVQKLVLLRRDEWADRLRLIPALVNKARMECPPFVPNANPNLENILMGKLFFGLNQTVSTKLDPEPFLVDADEKVTVYLFWWENYQLVEEIMAQLQDDQCNSDTPDIEVVRRGFNASLMLFLAATVLYLLETGWDSETEPVTKEVSLYPTVLNEMQARAEFVASKDSEYGQSLRRHGIPGVIARLWDKMCRYTNLKAMSEVNPKFESVGDSAKDLGGYSLILAGCFQEALDSLGQSKP